MTKKQNYIFTNKKHSEKSIMSTVLGVISVAAICVAVYLSFCREGAESGRYGAACFLAMIFAFVGVGLGVAARMEKDKFYLFAYIGIGLNTLALAGVSIVLYAGAYL